MPYKKKCNFFIQNKYFFFSSDVQLKQKLKNEKSSVVFVFLFKCCVETKQKVFRVIQKLGSQKFGTKVQVVVQVLVQKVKKY